MKINRLVESKRGFLKTYRDCSIHDMGHVFVATNKNGLNIGQSKTKVGIEAIIDDYMDKQSNPIKEDASYEWKPNTSFKHIKDIYEKVKANGYKYVNNEREEFMAAVKKAEAKGYKPEQCRQIKEWHREIWQHNRKSESLSSSTYLEKELADKSGNKRIEDAYQAGDLTIIKRGDTWYAEKCPDKIYNVVKREMKKYYPELTFLYDRKTESYEGNYSDKFRNLIKKYEDEGTSPSGIINDIIRYCPEDALKDLWYDRGYARDFDKDELTEDSRISRVEPNVRFKGKSAYTLTKDKKWEVDFDEEGNIVARTRHGNPYYFSGHINDKVNDFPSTDEDNIILAAREQHGIKFGKVNESVEPTDLKFVDNRKKSTISGDPWDDPGFDEYDVDELHEASSVSLYDTVRYLDVEIPEISSDLLNLLLNMKKEDINIAIKACKTFYDTAEALCIKYGSEVPARHKDERVTESMQIESINNPPLLETINEEDILHRLDQFQSSITVKSEDEKALRDILRNKNISFMIDDSTPGKSRFKLKYESLKEKLNLDKEGKALKRAIAKLVLDDDEELQSYVLAITKEVIEEKNGTLEEDLEEPLTGPNEGAEYGIASSVNLAIQKELETINEYDSLALNARAEGYDSVAEVIDHISSEEYEHVGELQQVLKSLAPNANAMDNADSVSIEEELEDKRDFKTWQEVLQHFKSLEKTLDDGEAVTALVDEEYRTNKGNPAYEIAYKKWCEGE